MRSILIALALATGVVDPAAANIILVPSVHATIQAGINAAAPGDTVQVGPGTYTGPSNRNLDFAGKNILLRSSAGAAITIIDCQNLARGMRFHSGETAAAVVQGFTIRNGLASGTLGGGMAIEGGARPTIRECRFESNRANTGGGISVVSRVTLIDCDFTANTADNGGGGIYAETATVDLSRCSFAQNQAGFGAGIYVTFESTVTMADCTFTANNPANLAGGVYGSDSQFVVRRCSFVENEGNEGAGMWLLRGTATVDSCTFRMNTAEWSGGGLRAETVDLFSLTNSTFENNSTLRGNPPGQSVSGGGGLAYLSHDPLNQAPYIADCVFMENKAYDSLGINGFGGGMRIQAGSGNVPLVERCTFTANHADKTGGGAIASGRYHNCVFEGNDSQQAGGLDGGREIIDCRFTDNHALTVGGGCIPSFGDNGGTILRGEFSGNSSGQRGGGVYWLNTFEPLVIEESTFSDNYSTFGGGIYMYAGKTSLITGCTFVGNTASVGGAASVAAPAPAPLVTFSESTFVGNGAALGGAFQLSTPVQIENTIIAFGIKGEPVACAGNGIGAMSCTDIYGNAGGNWTGCIADQLGINGNFSLDPRFCNVGGRDFTLAQTSPCTAANAPAGCGLIGAHPVGCATPIGIADAGAPGVTPMLRVTPNPMRGAGMIEWSGVSGRETELRLYDVAGRIVARRVEAGIGGGLPWSALVGAGGVPSGVYFLEVGEGRAVDARVRLVVVR